MPREQIACFQALVSSGTIDPENGIIRGVHVLENGKLATFEGPDGKPKSVKITPEHVNALFGYAGNRTLTVHKSHDWYGKSDGILSQVGRLKNHRIENGNLVADLHLAPGEYRDTALWNAQNDPEGMMLSAVFGYLPNDPKCLPRDYKACDLVETGAGVTALFSAHQTLHTAKLMEVSELITLLQDPQVSAAIQAMAKAVDKTSDDSVLPDVSESDVAEMEDAAGIAATNPEDKTQPALMARFFKAAPKAVAKLSKATATISDDQLAKVAKLAEASLIKHIGTGAILKDLVRENPAETATAKFNAAVAELEGKGVAKGAAFKAVIEKQPDLYNAHMASVQGK